MLHSLKISIQKGETLHYNSIYDVKKLVNS